MTSPHPLMSQSASREAFKSEARNSKSETNHKTENHKFQTATSCALTHGVAVFVWNFLLFGIWNLFRISDFVLRIYRGPLRKTAQTRQHVDATPLRLLPLLLAAIFALPVVAQSAATGSPTSEVFRQRIGQLTLEAASPNADVRARAGKTLTLLHKTLVDSLGPLLNDDDPEVRARVAELLTEIERDLQETRALACLGPALRKKFDTLRRDHPELCQAMLGVSENAKLTVLRTISRQTDREHVHEPLVLLGLHSRHATVQEAAIEAVLRSRYADAQTVTRLADLALSPPEMTTDLVPGTTIRHPPPPRAKLSATQIEALYALEKLASPLVAGRLAAAACQILPSDTAGRPIAIADVAVATGDQGLLLSLLPMLEQTKPGVSMSGSLRFSMAPSDVALYMLLKLTDQSPDAYGLETLTMQNVNQNMPLTFHFIGFPDDGKGRAVAIAKYKTWWQQHKHQETYKHVTATPLPTGDTNAAVDYVD